MLISVVLLEKALALVLALAGARTVTLVLGLCPQVSWVHKVHKVLKSDMHGHVRHFVFHRCH